MSKHLLSLSFLASFLTLLFCTLILPEIIFKAQWVISDFGVNQQTVFVFGLGMIVSALLFLAYLFLQKKRLEISSTTLIIFILSSISLIGLSIISYNTSKVIHWAFAFLFFFSFAAGIIMHGKDILKTKKFFGRFYFFLGLFSLLGGAVLYVLISPHALAQVFGIICFVIWGFSHYLLKK